MLLRFVIFSLLALSIINIKMKTSISVMMLALASFLACSCNNQTKVKKSVEADLEVDARTDTSAQTIKFGNTLFSLPSPYQLTMMIKNAGAVFNESLLNPISNNQNYSTLFKKCVNLGVYGADLAYLNINSQSALVVNAFSVVKVLATDLDLLATFSSELVDRVERNIDNKDSLLSIMSNTYRDIDVFLKESEREKEGTLVLAGGWVEAMYILSQMATETKDEVLKLRLGESKQPLENLIKILSPYYGESQDIAKLVDALIDLSGAYESVEQSYTYSNPEIDAESKVTVIKSTTKVVVTDSDLLSITDKLKAIRMSLVE